MKSIKSKVKKYLDKAVAITWDECHKIYIIMDDETAAYLASREHKLITEETHPKFLWDQLLDTWYKQSYIKCGLGLEFVDAISSSDGVPASNFKSVIPQGWGE